MKTKIVITTAVILSSFAICHSSFAQGALTPPGAPGPTMRTLGQIEPRTPISSAPYTITNPGSYYLTTNVTVNFGSAITISANGVTLDLNGFTISSTQYPAYQGTYGVLLNSVTNVTVANGFIRGGVTNNGYGVYGGSGFGYGVAANDIVPNSTLVSRISVFGCLYSGISGFTVVESCTVQTAGYTGIEGSTVKDSSAVDCGGDGIDGDQISDCHGQSSGYGNGLYATLAQNSYGYATGAGNGLGATTALNCYGVSSYTSSIGLSAITAQNCYGVCDNDFGPGLSAYTAQNCYGTCNTLRPGGLGLRAVGSAIGCYGESNTGIGLTAFTAAYCVGYCPGGTSISVTVGNGCAGAAGTNYVSYPYDMP
jgi:hypothetical protein